MSHGSKQANGAFEELDMFEKEEDEEDVGWTFSFLRSKFKEDNKYLEFQFLLDDLR